MRRAAGAALLAALAALSCGEPVRTTTRVLPSSFATPSAWIGRTADEVAAAWGEPTTREADGEGGTVLVYMEPTNVSVSTSEGLRPEATGKDPDPERTTTERLTRVRARFFLDAGQRVVRTWFAPSVYESGQETPPPPRTGS
jgi:hypothetical protein